MSRKWFESGVSRLTPMAMVLLKALTACRTASLDAAVVLEDDVIESLMHAPPSASAVSVPVITPSVESSLWRSRL